MYPFKRSVLSVALASALQTMAGAAYAQPAEEAAPAQAEAAQGQEGKKKDVEVDAVVITVTGIRAGIERAIDTKRESNEIVESVTAEDIGKLPDVSIAESIARLPGLTAQRVAGRASTIQIRGLADDFGTALLNGREQVSVGHNRGVEFDQYPSELLSAVKVYKTPNASLIGQGLSGTVDLQTVSPLAYNERVMAFNARLEENSNGKLNPGSDDQGKRLSFSYIDQFMDGKVGLAIGVAHLDTPGQSKMWEGYSHGSVTVDGEDAFIIGASKAQASSNDNVRDGYMAVLEIKPNDSFKSTLDLYYSEFEVRDDLRFLEAQLQGAGWAGVTNRDLVRTNNWVTSGGFDNVFPIMRNDVNTREDEITAFGWKNEFDFSDAWSGFVDISHSEASRDEMILESYSGYGNREQPGALTTVDFTLGYGAGYPVFTYGRDYTDPVNMVLGDIGGWNQAGYVKFPHVDDELTSFRVGGEYLFQSGMFESLKFGVNYSDREKTRSIEEYFLRLQGLPSFASTAPIPASVILGTVDLGMWGNTNGLAYDPLALLNTVYQPLDDSTSNVHPDIYNKTWTVNEKITTWYAQLNIDTEWGTVPVRGNVGVQYVDTEQSSVGVDISSPEVLSRGGDEYTDILPSLNLAFTLFDDHVLRVAAAKQTARPRLDDLRANQDIGVPTAGENAGIWTASGGNPELKPWEANAFDVSYEIYFGDAGYFSVASFYKDLKTYIYTDTVEYDFSGVDTSTGTYPLIPTSPIGLLTGPSNGEGGSLKGWEVAFSVPFNLMSDALDGFGVLASYSDTSSSINPLGPDQPSEPLPGLSEEVSNITLYYENYGFQARISQRSRSDFLGEVTGFGADRTRRNIRGEDVVDMQLGYAFDESSSLDGLSFLFQINNLTNEEYQEYDTSNGDLPLKYAVYGRTVLLGANYKF